MSRRPRAFPPDRARLSMTSPARSAASRLRRAQTAAALVLYAIASVAFFGIPLWSGFSHLRLGLEAAGDAQIPMWGLAWYPYALAHRLDPLFTHAAWAPAGCTLAWSTTFPGAALAMWPVTRAAGIVATYNLLCLMTPALSAFTAFALCRYLTGNFRASLAGGFVFGFSTYISWELLDHLSLAMVFLLPLFPYLALSFLSRETAHGFDRAKYVTALSALVIGQFLLSPEILATATLFGAIAIVLAMGTFDEAHRARLKNLSRVAAISYGLAALVLAPYLVRFFPSPFGIAPIYNPAHCSTDLLNFVFPTDPSMFSRAQPMRWLRKRVTWGCEPTAYLGLLPVVALLFASNRPRSPRERMLLAMGLVVAVATLGPVLHFNSRALLPLPWLFMVPIPLLNNALLARFTAYLFLVFATITAVWLARREGRAAGRWVLCGAALVSILPAFPLTPYVASDNVPAFFKEGMYKRYITVNENVLILPFGASGYAVLWQAEANFHFRIPQGLRLLANTIPLEFARWPIVPALADDDP